VSGAPLFVAEVSSNHARDLDRCLAFVDAAADTGCGAVKFQLFRVHELFAPEILAVRADLRARVDWELPVEFLAPIAERCRERGLAFWCTPFDLQAVAELEPHVDVLKVASYELLWDDLLAACARTGKPVCLSTGMASLDEIAHAVDTLHSHGCRDLTLLHCVSGYPAPADECNLGAIETLRRFGCDVGWSDHSVDAAVVSRAVSRWGATTVEFHLDLDGTGDEFVTGHCGLPDAIAAVIADLARGAQADGDGVKQPVPAEAPDREWRADPSDGLRPLRRVREAVCAP
jgi:N-acetylneuraminate synthase